MGGCVIECSETKIIDDNYEIFVPIHKINNQVTLSSEQTYINYDSNNEEFYSSILFPPDLVKSKNNPRGIVIVRKKRRKH